MSHKFRQAKNDIDVSMEGDQLIIQVRLSAVGNSLNPCRPKRCLSAR